MAGQDYRAAADAGYQRVAAWLEERCRATEQGARMTSAKGWLTESQPTSTLTDLDECRSKYRAWSAIASAASL